MTKSERAKLRELALKATPGPWDIAPGNFIVADCFNGDPTTGKIVAEIPCQGANPDDVDYIAAANPQTVLALLDDLDRREKFIEEHNWVKPARDVDPDAEKVGE